MLTHDRPVGRRSRPRPVEPLEGVPPRRRRADRAISALGLAAGTTTGILLLLTWVDRRGAVDLGLPEHLLTLGWLVPLLLVLLALLVPVVAPATRPARRRAHPSSRRPLPPSRALAVAAGGTAALLLVIAVAV